MDMINRELYREISKQVHPDLNGADFTSKMQDVNKFKNNPDVLLRLAKQWGLNLNGSFDSSKFDSRANSYKDDVYSCVVGAIIRHSYIYKFSRKDIRGVITNIRTIKRGKYSGAKEFTVYNFIDRSIFKLKTRSDNPFIAVGMAHEDDLAVGKMAIESVNERKRVMDIIRRDIANNRFNTLNIKPNTNYSGTEVRVLVNYKGGSKWKILLRTTEKSAYVLENSGQRRIPIKHILRMEGD